MSRPHGIRAYRTRSKSGEIYPYFYCSARQTKRNDCTQKAVLIHVVEDKLVEEYQRRLRRA